jgi:hypothetical protein
MGGRNEISRSLSFRWGQHRVWKTLPMISRLAVRHLQWTARASIRGDSVKVPCLALPIPIPPDLVPPSRFHISRLPSHISPSHNPFSIPPLARNSPNSLSLSHHGTRLIPSGPSFLSAPSTRDATSGLHPGEPFTR